MRIAYYTPFWPASLGQNGIGTYVETMVEAMRAAGRECVVIPRIAASDQDGGGVYPALPLDNNLFSGAALKIRRRLDLQMADRWEMARRIADALERASMDAPIDFLEIEETHGIASLVRKMSKTPVAIRLHGPHFLVRQGPASPAGARRDALEGRAILEADIVSSPSQALLDLVAAEYGGAPKRACIAPNPVPIPREDECWRLDQCDRDLLLFVGRFDSVKGADILLNAFVQIHRRNPAMRLRIVGKDLGVDRPGGGRLTFSDYQERFVPEEVRDAVEFLGPVPRVRIDALRREAAICVVPSRFEAFGYNVAEAMALGCPVIASATPGIGERFGDETAVRLTPTEDADALTDAVLTLAGDDRQLEALGAAAREKAVRSLSPEAVMDQILQAYRASKGQGAGDLDGS